MDLLGRLPMVCLTRVGNNLAKVRKCLEDSYNLKFAINLLTEMLDAIEEVHDKGFIHRDVKAVSTANPLTVPQSNFVLSKNN